MCCCATNLMAQNRTITGKVTAKEDGTSIPGATVSVKGTTLGTVTDVEGKYKLDVPNDPKTVLVYSFIGYKTSEMEIKTDSIINIALILNANSLNEVVVTAIGMTAKRDRVSSSTQIVSGLQGRTAGVSIRGIATNQLSKTEKSDILKAQILRDTKPTQEPNTEEYDKTTENNFVSPLKRHFQLFLLMLIKLLIATYAVF